MAGRCCGTAPGHFAQALPQCLAVIRPGQRERARWLAEAGCRVLESAAAEAGMGCALAAAVTASEDAAGWVVALGDMPWLETAAIEAVAAALESPCALAAAGYQASAAIRWVSVAAGAGAMALDGERGARELLLGQAPAAHRLVRRLGAARRRTARATSAEAWPGEGAQRVSGSATPISAKSPRTPC